MRKHKFEDTPDLPGWAIRKTFPGELVRMQQALTKDGKRMGNAVITDIHLRPYEGEEGLGLRITVVTEAGNVILLTATEFEEFFSAGDFVMYDFPTTESEEAWDKYQKDVFNEYTDSRYCI